MIPGEGNVLKGVQLAAGVVSGGMAVSGNSPANAALSSAGLGLNAAELSGTATITVQVAYKPLASVIGKSLKIIPLAGNALSGYSAYRDIQAMNAYYNDCMEGKN
jgi:hypothetical protein